VFKGPMLNTLATSPTSQCGGSGLGRASSHSRSASAGGRRSGEIIQEEDEDEVEEVDAFSPITAGEEIEEQVFPPSQVAASAQEGP
jgi:hypothetical protein